MKPEAFDRGWLVTVKATDGGPRAFELQTQDERQIEEALCERLSAITYGQTLVLSRWVFAGRASPWKAVASFDLTSGFVAHEENKLNPRFRCLFVDASRQLETRTTAPWAKLLGEVQNERPDLFPELG